jgi:hypothetical protein
MMTYIIVTEIGSLEEEASRMCYCGDSESLFGLLDLECSEELYYTVDTSPYNPHIFTGSDLNYSS